MRHISTTPSGRRSPAAGLLAGQALAAGTVSVPAGTDKWTILQDLTEGREAFGLTDRNLSVLSALLSFHPARDLADGALTVFPSNSSLSARLHGMPESTLRRHLAALVEAGLIRRQDSPNGKRYATRDGRGRIDRVFGFDLGPLLRRVAEIREAAEAARETARLMRRARQTVVLLLRDIASRPGMDQPPAEATAPRHARLAELRLRLRRKLGLADLSALEAALRQVLAETGAAEERSPGMSGNDARNERHQHNADSDHPESELAMKQEDGDKLPLPIVLKAAPDISQYAAEPLRDWKDLTRLAEFVRPMMGITAETWLSARQSLGDRTASITLACILQRFTRIRNPGAYLRRLSLTPDFRPGPMVMALLRGAGMARG
ncbi:replication initiation protein [Paracoccus sp. YIM 132242]|uniref:Replication initiation protein n=1 Tax=Paracoccus lichenicola TaxID=2665644 RepID=A0A6L6HRS4_9RHOB|nr:plasmid replication protein RepC [Paracoccus lichenicola]MTE01051.1 replication initiation protein [Paracoccus lichenicola]